MSMPNGPVNFPHNLPAKLITACVFDHSVWQIRDVEVINLVTIRQPGVPDHLITPNLRKAAPPKDLLVAYRTRKITWEDFYLWYLAYLEDYDRFETLELVAKLLEKKPRILIAGSEPADAGGEEQVRCARRIFRSWLLGEALP